MGLVKAAFGAIGGVTGDQWKDYFYCDSLPTDVLLTKGHKRTSSGGSNNKVSDNIISQGSVIAVADGQCMIIVEQGMVVDICAEPGEFIYDQSTEPSVFSGSLSSSIPAVLKNMWKRFTFGGERPGVGEPPKKQLVYYFNTKELVGNKYGTSSPVPFRVVDDNIGLDVDIAIRCFGEYSYKIVNPILFYTNVSGNVEAVYTRSQIDSQLKTELLTALQPAFAKISAMGVRYSMLPMYTAELADALNEVLSAKWSDLRGISIISIGVSSVKASEEDENMIKELQRNATFRNPDMAAAHLVDAQAEAMKSAAANKGAGPLMAFMGMNMAQNMGGMKTQNLFAMGQQQMAQHPQQAPVPAGWTCSCGQNGNTGKFCSECAGPKPQESGWTCSCGAINKGKFCSECAGPKPQESGWTCSCGAINKGKFCSECAGPKPQESGWTCSCGAINAGKFCSECAGPKPAGAPQNE